MKKINGALTEPQRHYGSSAGMITVTIMSAIFPFCFGLSVTKAPSVTSAEFLQPTTFIHQTSNGGYFLFKKKDFIVAL